MRLPGKRVNSCFLKTKTISTFHCHCHCQQLLVTSLSIITALYQWVEKDNSKKILDLLLPLPHHQTIISPPFHLNLTHHHQNHPVIPMAVHCRHHCPHRSCTLLQCPHQLLNEYNWAEFIPKYTKRRYEWWWMHWCNYSDKNNNSSIKSKIAKTHFLMKWWKTVSMVTMEPTIWMKRSAHISNIHSGKICDIEHSAIWDRLPKQWDELSSSKI